MDFNLETVCAEILSVYQRNAMSMSNAELLRRLKFPQEIVFEGINDLVVRGKLRMTTNSLNQVLFELVEEIDDSEDTDIFNDHIDSMLQEWDELPAIKLPKEFLRTLTANPAVLSILLDDKLKSIYELLVPVVRTNRDRDKLINSLNEISRLRGE